MRRGRYVWGGILLLGAVIETYGILHPGNNDTLSEWTRWAFQTDTATGRAIFIGAWGAFAAWFAWHILDKNGGKE